LQNLAAVLAVRQFEINLFCSEQLRDAELKVENGGEDGGPAFHSKPSLIAGRATKAEATKLRILREATDTKV
jgi:hypothetical protein